MCDTGKLAGWSSQPVKRAHTFAWPPSSDEDSSTTPPSSSVGPSTPTSEPKSKGLRQVKAQARETPARNNPAPAQPVDLIDFGEDYADDGLGPSLQPDTKEVNLVSFLAGRS